MNRTGALAVAAPGVPGLGGGARVGWVAPGGGGGPPPAARGLLLGQKLDLNQVPEAALASVPGVGASLAHHLVRTRQERGPFVSWNDVASVPGVGPARLQTLRATV